MSVIATSPAVLSAFPGLASLPRDTAQAAVDGLNAVVNVNARPVRNLGLTARGVNAVAVAVRDATGTPFASLALAGPAAQLPVARIADAVAMLRTEGAAVARIAQRVLPEGVYAGRA